MSDAPKPNFLARAAVAWEAFKTGTTPQWFGPSQPMVPQAPPEAAGRRWDYPHSINLQSQPRADEEIGFAELRTLAKDYPLLALIIETRLDQMVGRKWSLQAREGHTADKSRIKAAREFLEQPDKEHDFDQWARMLTADMLTIDAATLYPRRTNGGGLYALEPIDGATIKRVVDQYGRTPMPPYVAYQQVLHGMPATDYAFDQLIYAVRNPRTNRLYGLSAVEQIALTVNIGLRRDLHKLNYYTEGTVPDALCATPDNWTVDQISEFQQYWDALLTDNGAEKRKMRFVPGGIAKGFVQTKEALLKDEFDEWLARIVCYAFSVSNQWAVKQMNRATSETAQDQATMEGLEPTKTWLASVVNRCLRGPMGYPDLEMIWDEDRQPNPKEQADTAKVYASVGAMTINEMRSNIGLEPVEGGDVPLIITASNAIPLSEAVKPPAPPPPQLIGHNGGPPLDAQTADEPPADMAKRATPEARLQSAWAEWFAQEAPIVARMLVRGLPKDASMAKAAGSVEDANAAARQTAEDIAAAMAVEDTPASGTLAVVPSAQQTVADAVMEAIVAAVEAADWPAIQASTASVLREVAVAGAEDAIAGKTPTIAAGITVRAQSAEATALSPTTRSTTTQDLRTADATKLANPRAVAWAEARAAELVSGVDDATRNTLRKLVTQAIAEGKGTKWLADQIEKSAAFSPERAATIAGYEVKKAYAQGSLEGWKMLQARTGVKLYKRIVLGPLETHCVACLACVAEGAIPVDDDFVAGPASPFHPNCGCSTTAAAPPAKTS